MSTLDRYVLGRVLRPFLPVLFGLGVLFFLGAAFRLLRDEDLTLRQVSLALPWALPYLLPYLLPVAYAVGGALALARLVDQREVLALAALGLSPAQVARRALLLALPLSAASLLITAQVAPVAYRLRRQVVQTVLLEMAGQGEHLSRSDGRLGLRVYARRYGPQGLEGVVVSQQGNERRDGLLVTARRGRFLSGQRDLQLELSDVDLTYQPDPRGKLPAVGPLRVTLPRWSQGFDLDTQSPRRVGGMTSAELLQELRGEGPDPGGTRLKARLELGFRLALALGPLLAGVCAFPLTLLIAPRSPLLGCVLGAAGGCCGLFGPLVLARGLAEMQGQAAWLALGVALPLGLGSLLLARTGRAT